MIRSSQLQSLIFPNQDLATVVVPSHKQPLACTAENLPSAKPSRIIEKFLDVNPHPLKKARDRRIAKMNSLQVRPAEFSVVKTKAVEDAKKMYASVVEEANKAGLVPPKYQLDELIGKGSFGRVYKG